MTLTKYKIPLIKDGDDIEWKDTSWLIEYLRHLANKLEKKEFEVYRTGIEKDAQDKTPQLVVFLRF